MTPKLEYKQLARGAKEGYIFTDAQGLEHMNDIAEKVTEAFQEMANLILMRISYGHNDTCDTMLISEFTCSCGHDALIAWATEKH